MLTLVFALISLGLRLFDWRDDGLGLVWPSAPFTKDTLMMVGAILGTTISPYIFNPMPAERNSSLGEARFNRDRFKQDDCDVVWRSAFKAGAHYLIEGPLQRGLTDQRTQIGIAEHSDHPV